MNVRTAHWLRIAVVGIALGTHLEALVPGAKYPTTGLLVGIYFLTLFLEEKP